MSGRKYVLIVSSLKNSAFFVETVYNKNEPLDSEHRIEEGTKKELGTY